MFIKPEPAEPATAFVADRRLGLTADRSRVVDYNDVEAAFLFRAPGGKVTVAEAERYRISARNPLTPRPSSAPASPSSPESDAGAKMAEPAEDKMIPQKLVADKGRISLRRGRAR